MRTNKTDPTNVARQRRRRERLRHRLQPLTPEEWRMLAAVIQAALRDYTPSQRQRIAATFNAVLLAHGAGLRIELTDFATP